MKLLRTYSCTARKEHFCDYCTHYICAGERYHASVYAIPRYIIVLKQHDSCPVDPLREERELLEKIERDEHYSIAA